MLFQIYLDPDDDGDGYSTLEEGTVDTDNEGIPDYLDYLDYSSELYPETGPIRINNYVNLVGEKRYELTNHLGDVLVVVNDKKIPTLEDGRLKWLMQM